MSRDVVVLSAVRTAIGSFGGGLKDVPAASLGATVIGEAVSRAQIDKADIGHVVVGNVIHSEPRDAYIARMAALEAGLSIHTPCLTVNRLCGSGLQAIVSATQHIMLNDTDVAVAAGAESMSRAAYYMPAARWGQRMGNATLIDAIAGTLEDPFGHGHMGVTAERIAARYKIGREAQDRYALESQRRARRAIDEGRFISQIVPVERHAKGKLVPFEIDEHVRDGITPQTLQKLQPVFQQDGTVTAGNASGLNDGAAAVVLMAAEVAERANLQPLARLVAYAHAAVEPEVMGLGPIPAVQRVFARAGLKPADMDVIESNEAFAAQAIAVAQELGLDPERVNPNGGAIALGHPVGATGCILTVKALYELQRIGGRYALVTMCIGGGQGIAAIYERI